MAQAIEKIESTKSQHSAEVQEFETAQAEYQLALDSQTEAKTQLDSYSLRLRSLTDSVALISTPEGIAILKDQIAAVQAEFNEQRPILAKEIAESNVKVNKARTRLAAATGAYNAVIPDETKLMNRITLLSNLFDTLQDSSKRVFTDNNILLTTLETTGVGVASASFTIWGDEEARFRNILSQTNPDYQVSRLPIYDIRLNPVQSNSTPSTLASTETRIGSTLNNSNALAFVNNATPPLANTTSPDLAIFESANKPVVPQTSVLTGSGTGTYQTLVTRGSYCTGNSARHYRSVTPENPLAGDPSITLMKVG
ncbi:MAG: hypothetical protein EOP07_15510, partial [Proteobacteria bacterium]